MKSLKIPEFEKINRLSRHKPPPISKASIVAIIVSIVAISEVFPANISLLAS